MKRASGTAAMISAAARGQGRSRAVRLAAGDAGIIALAICHDIPAMGYPNASKEDVDEEWFPVQSAWVPAG